MYKGLCKSLSKNAITVLHPLHQFSNRKVWINGIYSLFNYVVCVDHLYLEDIRLLNFMDSRSRYSAALTVPSASLSDSIIASEYIWVSQFWPPSFVQEDLAFRQDEFDTYLSQYGTIFRHFPTLVHQNNMLESKHGMIRNIFLRLKFASQ